MVGRGVDVGVDFEEETVDEEIVIALPEDGGMRGLGAGVVAVGTGGGTAGALGGAMEEDGSGSGTWGRGCSVVEDRGLSCADGGGGARRTVTSSYTGFRMSSMWLRFRGAAANADGESALVCRADSGL